MPVSRPLDAAVEAARRAGDLLLGHFGSLDPSEVEEKGRNDVVSRADRESEALVKELLLGAFPGDLFVGEEGGATGSNGGAPAWIVDPLDGTANFVRGFPHWAVSIGRTAGGRDGELVLGVVWDPVKGDLFVAEKGSGAFRNGRRVGVSPREGLAGAFLATGFPFRVQSRIDTYLRVFKAVFLEAQSIRRAGSAALDLAYVSCGVFDGFFELGLSPWDSAAGAVLVSEAGGLVTDFEGGGAWRERGNILAAGPGVHAALARLVAGLGIRDEQL
ncbi:MAG: inositol monophosphatase family protein [Thermoanaerobaculia bacterium]|jgi:myo-inositol-1(or 4)-monophosphatase|nr:inositol monophosphatase family protein [Thermoanaerobaculia bacterium]